jgi:hypothetical protein
VGEVEVRPFREDDTGFLSIGTLVGLVLLLVGLAFIWFGLTRAGVGCVGDGLMWIGVGLTIGDFGGFVTVKHPLILVAGGAGIVTLLVGAVFKATRLAC